MSFLSQARIDEEREETKTHNVDILIIIIEEEIQLIAEDRRPLPNGGETCKQEITSICPKPSR